MSCQLKQENNHLSIVFKYILNSYLDIFDYLTILSVSKIEDFDIANFLAIDLRYDNDLALKLASESDNLLVVKYLLEKGANVHANYECALGIASAKGS